MSELLQGQSRAEQLEGKLLSTPSPCLHAQAGSGAERPEPRGPKKMSEDGEQQRGRTGRINGENKRVSVSVCVQKGERCSTQR